MSRPTNVPGLCLVTKRTTPAISMHLTDRGAVLPAQMGYVGMPRPSFAGRSDELMAPHTSLRQYRGREPTLEVGCGM